MGERTSRSFWDKIQLFLANKMETPSTPSLVDIVPNVVKGTPISAAPQIEINKDTIIRNKFFSGFARTKPIEWFVIHGTGGGGTLNWMRYQVSVNSARGKNYSKGVGLFHYLIERDGKIWEIIDPTKWVWHASIGNFDGGTVGIELVNTSFNNQNAYTAEQYNSLLNLYNHLRKENNKMDVMISHNRAKIKVNNGRLGGKICPGPGFDWIMWRNMVSQYYSFKHNNDESLWDIEPR